MKLAIEFLAGAVEKAYQDIDGFDGFPRNMGNSEIGIARRDLRQRLDRLIAGLSKNDLRSLGMARPTDDPRYFLYPGDMTSPVSAVAILRIVEGRIVVIKFVFRSPFGSHKRDKP